jgi:NAD-dependent deacetylase
MKTLIDYINEALYCVGFTGAGVSTLSGIPDFRGKNGLYSSFDADKLFDFDYFCKNPSYFYEMSKDFIYNIDSKIPSVVHEVFALLEQTGRMKAVITQNIDMLHTRAGSKNVFEIHGSPKVHTCLNCGNTCSFEEIVPVVRNGKVPHCISCKDIMKPDIIFFGEMLDQAVLYGAVTEASRADLIIVCGTSLVVQPAASIPVYTLDNGGKVIIVNDSPTPLDNRCAARFYSLEEVFAELRCSF